MELKYISIRQILDDLLNHPLLQDLTMERAVNYTVEFIKIVGMPKVFMNKIAILTLEDYRTFLPCDFHKMIQVRVSPNDKGAIFRYTTDNFHLSDDHSDYPDLTYKLQGGILIASKRDGNIEIAYESIPVDEDGYPMIADNSSFVKALELYIKNKMFTILFDTGKINPAVYQNVKQQYAWAVGQAQTSLIMPSIDEMESITNMWNTLIQRSNEHNRGFIGNGSKEKLKLQ